MDIQIIAKILPALVKALATVFLGYTVMLTFAAVFIVIIVVTTYYQSNNHRETNLYP